MAQHCSELTLIIEHPGIQLMILASRPGKLPKALMTQMSACSWAFVHSGPVLDMQSYVGMQKFPAHLAFIIEIGTRRP
jgi:hypothetical protein